MKARISISVKILLLSFLNVFLLVLVFAVFIRIQYRLDLGSLLLSPGRDRILAVSRLIALQLPNTERKDWDRLLAGYTSTTHASACLFNAQGTQLAGPSVTLPQAVLAEVRHDHGPPIGPPGLGPGEGIWPPERGPGPAAAHAVPGGGSWQSSSPGLSLSHIYCWTPAASQGTSPLLGERSTFQGTPPPVSSKRYGTGSDTGRGRSF